MKIGFLAWIIFTGVMVGLILAYILVTTSVNNTPATNVDPVTQIQNNNTETILANSSVDSEKPLTIYGSILTDEEIQNARIDCENRGGIFDVCASPCSPDTDVCIEVCAYACVSVSDF